MGTKRTAIFEEEEEGEDNRELYKTKTQMFKKKTHTLIMMAKATSELNRGVTKKKSDITGTSQSRSIIREEEEGEDEDTSKSNIRQLTLKEAEVEEEASHEEDRLNTDEDM